MRNQRLLSFLVLVLLLSGIFGCSSLWISTSPTAGEERVAIPEEGIQPLDVATENAGLENRSLESLKAGNLVQPAFVEVLWKIPAEPVIAYHLYLGDSPDKMTDHVRVPVDELERTKHPTFGEVYRYRASRTALTQDVWVSLKAENIYGISPESQLIRIPPPVKVPSNPR